LFTWIITALGAAVVFIVKDIGRRTMDCLLGFSGGVMLAAGYWSLLATSIEMSHNKSVPVFQCSSVPVWFPPALGFVYGA
jgi:ZIP family zinc transporter